jgi:hypothetical protein
MTLFRPRLVYKANIRSYNVSRAVNSDQGLFSLDVTSQNLD